MLDLPTKLAAMHYRRICLRTVSLISHFDLMREGEHASGGTHRRDSNASHVLRRLQHVPADPLRFYVW